MMKIQYLPNRSKFVAWCLRLFLMSAVVPFGNAWALCVDGVPDEVVCTLPPWCVDGVACEVGDITFEIKPYSVDRCLKLDGNGVIPTIIYGQAYLLVDEIDTSTLSLNGLEVRMRGAKGPLCSIHDANQDGYPDLFCQFEDDPTQWVTGNATAELSGTLLDGSTLIAGSGSICIQ